MVDPHIQFRQSRYFPSLDGLRAISILAVVWHHSGFHGSGIFSRGYLGVQLFFAISGFLITTLLLRERESTGHINLRDFYVRRTLRIFPLYYATIAIYALLVHFSERATERGALFHANLPAYLTYTSNWFVDLIAGKSVIFYFAWSLATEEQFYLCWPSIMRFSRTWRFPVFAISTLLVVGELARFARDHHFVSTSALLPKILASIASPICLGCICAIAVHGPKGFALAYRIAGRPWSAPLALVLLVGAFSFELPSFANAVIMVYLVLACVIRQHHYLRAALDNSAVRYLGTISYGMYLLNMLALNLVRKILGDSEGSLQQFACTTIVVILIASISYYGFEAPFLRLKKRFSH